MIRSKKARVTAKLKPAEKAALYGKEKILFVSAIDDAQDRVEIAFQDVPANARYFLPAVGSHEGSPAYLAQGSEAKSAVKQVRERDLAELVRAFRALRSLGIDVPDIGGYVFPRGPQARKFKLVENGWKPLLPTMLDALDDPRVRQAILARFTALPDLSLVLNQYFHRFKGDVGAFGHWLSDVAYQPKFGRWLRERMEELPALKAELDPIWDANLLTGHNHSSTCAIRPLVQGLPLRGYDLGEGGDPEEFRNALLGRYPELYFLEDRHFCTRVLEDADAARSLLTLIFGGPRRPDRPYAVVSHND